jgi:antitoxin YobK
MNIGGVSEAIERIKKRPSGSWFVGARSAQVVDAAETALGFTFPAAYRLFVKELGTGNVGPHEIFGLIDDDFVDSSGPDAVWLTFDARRDLGLPESMIVIYFDGGVDYFVLDTAESDDPRVLLWRPGVSKAGDVLEVMSPSFGQFLLDLVEVELAGDDD